MILYIVRHAEPDYATDSLTELGKQEAQFVCKRLNFSGVDEIHASPMGRAQQTAQPLSEMTGLPIITEDWAWELRKESHTTYPDGVLHPMSGVSSLHYHALEYRGVGLEEAFDVIPGMQGAQFKERYHDIAAGLDDMLARCGYRRNADGFYDMVAPNEKHVALFCHCAMQRVLISHLFHLPYQFVASSLFPHHTGITALYFESDPAQEQTMPKLYSFGDVGHFYAEGEEVVHFQTNTVY